MVHQLCKASKVSRNLRPSQSLLILVQYYVSVSGTLRHFVFTLRCCCRCFVLMIILYIGTNVFSIRKIHNFVLVPILFYCVLVPVYSSSLFILHKFINQVLVLMYIEYVLVLMYNYLNK